jgi:hypothetical protein
MNAPKLEKRSRTRRPEVLVQEENCGPAMEPNASGRPLEASVLDERSQPATTPLPELQKRSKGDSGSSGQQVPELVVTKKVTAEPNPVEGKVVVETRVVKGPLLTREDVARIMAVPEGNRSINLSDGGVFSLGSEVIIGNKSRCPSGWTSRFEWISAMGRLEGSRGRVVEIHSSDKGIVRVKVQNGDAYWFPKECLFQEGRTRQGLQEEGESRVLTRVETVNKYEYPRAGVAVFEYNHFSENTQFLAVVSSAAAMLDLCKARLPFIQRVLRERGLTLTGASIHRTGIGASDKGRRVTYVLRPSEVGRTENLADTERGQATQHSSYIANAPSLPVTLALWAGVFIEEDQIAACSRADYEGLAIFKNPSEQF